MKCCDEHVTTLILCVTVFSFVYSIYRNKERKDTSREGGIVEKIIYRNLLLMILTDNNSTDFL